MDFKPKPNYMDKENIEDVYPMSDIQLGMFYYSLKDPGTAVYHGQMVFVRKDRNFEPEILKKAIALMVEKHPILRTGFNMHGFKEPVQIVFKKIIPEIQHDDLTHMENAQQEVYIKSYLAEDRKLSFNLKVAKPLWRMKTFALDSETVCFLWSRHHAITDGWSSASLMTELNNTYIRLKSNPNYTPRKLKNTYKQFVLEQRQEKKNNRTIEFWKKELAGYRRMDFPGNPDQMGDSKGAVSKTYLKNPGRELREKLNLVAKKYQTSFRNLCFGAYIYMLNMLSYDGEVVTGLVTHNRPICEDGDQIIGCFLNTVPVRINIPCSLKWFEYILLIHNKLIQLESFNRMSLMEIVKITGEKSQDQNPIFDTLFSFVDFFIYNQAEPLHGEENRGSSDSTRLSIQQSEVINTLFNCEVFATAGDFFVRFSYSTSLLGDGDVETLAVYFEKVLNKFVNEPDGHVDKEKLISTPEKQNLLYTFNNTEAKYPHNKTIHELFAEQVERNPDNTAVVGSKLSAAGKEDNVHLIYRELNRQSNHLARLLRGKDIKPDTIVGIMVERSLEMIIAILGILKAGAAYLPIDPEYPTARINYMLSDSRAKILLTTKNIAKAISFDKEMIDLDSLSLQASLNLSEGCLFNSHHSSKNRITHHSLSLAYVIYTSGTTRKPKGVMIQHKSLVNYIWWGMRQYIPKGSLHLAFPLYTNISFDLTATSIFLPLISGNTIVIYDKEKKQLPIQKVIKEDKVDIIKVTPSHFKVLQCENAAETSNTRLRKFIVGGEQLQTQLVRDVVDRFSGDIEIFNEYGPTEATIGCMIYTFDYVEDKRIGVPIGLPINNVKVYILDKCLRPVPINSAGEIYISGDALARGYLNHPGLTAEAFTGNPFVKRERMYKSGDIARWLPDRNIEFIGRIDHQVKIRGFRIQLAEIENQLLKHDGIKEAVVTLLENENGDKHLCAYIVPDPERTSLLIIPELKKFLSGDLPDYMIPSHFVQIEKIPLTANGKLDKKNLDLYGRNISTGVEYVDPASEMEKIIADIWKAVLNVDKVGIYDNFFDLGGNSISVIRLNSRLNEVLGTDIPVVKMFNYVTINSFVDYLTRGKMETILSNKEKERPRLGARDKAKQMKEKQKSRRKSVERINV